MKIKKLILKGISNAMSDIGIADGQCSESANVIVENDEITPLQPPKIIDTLPISTNYDLVYIHKTANYTNYIGIYNGYLCRVLSDTFTNIVALTEGEIINAIKAIGNTLIISTSTRMFYVLYKDNAYTYLGEQIPEAIIDFSYNQDETSAITDSDLNTLDILREIDPNFVSTDDSNPLYEVYKGYTKSNIKYEGETGYAALTDDEKLKSKAYALFAEKIWGRYAVEVDYQRNSNHLLNPIFIRYAIRLYDGSYIRQSIPILIDPNNFSQNYVINSFKILHSSTVENEISINNYRLSLAMNLLFYTLIGNIKAAFVNNLILWKDIIQGIDIFITPEVYITANGAKIRRVVNNGNNDYSTAYIEQRTNEETLNEVLSKSNFYRVKELSIEELTEGHSYQITFTELNKYLGDVLLTQPRLDDDYLSHHKNRPLSLNEYNGRLNMANIEQTIYRGHPMLASKIINEEERDNDYYKFKIIYYIRADGNILKSTITHGVEATNYLGAWIAYPDARCYKADIYYYDYSKETYYKTTVKMKPHPFLNLSYYFHGFIGTNGSNLYPGTAVNTVDDTEVLTSWINNKLYQSEVNNPFLFKASGIHTLPSTILSMATVTAAISQGQFGQFPLYVFCADGIWAMSCSNTGEYLNTVPMSREVCSNVKSITNIDGAIIFVSQKGVMILEGGKVTPISDNMLGKHYRADVIGSLSNLEEYAATYWGSELPQKVSDDLSFLDFITDAFIAYDYASNRLVFVNNNCIYQYIFCIKSKTWHKMYFGNSFKKALNSYPDCYLQANSGEVYNFSVLTDVNDVAERVFGLIVTRGLTLDEPYTRKRIDAIKIRGDYEKGMVKCMLYGSFDGINYTYINSIKGKSFKFYKLAFFLSLLPTERLSQIDIAFETRWDNKLR